MSPFRDINPSRQPRSTRRSGRDRVRLDEPATPSQRNTSAESTPGAAQTAPVTPMAPGSAGSKSVFGASLAFPECSLSSGNCNNTNYLAKIHPFSNVTLSFPTFAWCDQVWGPAQAVLTHPKQRPRKLFLRIQSGDLAALWSASTNDITAARLSPLAESTGSSLRQRPAYKN